MDKFWTSALLEQCGLPTPETRSSARRPRRPIAAFRELGDVIVKPLFGSMGLGMVRVSDEEMAFRVFRTIEQIRGVYYLQRTIEHEGRDVRAFVVGGRVLGGHRARAPTAGAPTLARAARRRADRAVRAVGRAGGPGRRRGRRGVRRGGPAAGARRHRLRARGERHPRVAGAAGGHRRRRGGRASSTTCVRRGRGEHPAEVAAAAQLACLLEVSAPKPGNVSPGRHFHDTRYEDFLASAVAIGPALARRRATGRSAPPSARPSRRPRRWTRSNTNLGIVLLLAPLARGGAPAAAARCGTRVREVLAETTVADAAEVYAAIRLARPGGLGAPRPRTSPPRRRVTLREAMALAAERDSVAREYATDFAITFEVGAPALRRGTGRGLDWTDAVVETFLALLAAVPDTHIARKLGPAAAEAVSRAGAARCEQAGGVRTEDGRRGARGVRRRAPRRRPTAAIPAPPRTSPAPRLFVVILEDGWNR